MRNTTPIARHLQAKIDQELEPRERVAWVDMPIPRFFTPAATGMFLFGIPWTAFALFWTAGAAWGTIQSGEKGLYWAFPLFGVPFILIGIGMLSSPWRAYKKALETVYVITNKRAITFDGGRGTTIRSYLPDNLQEIYRKEHRDGPGDVVITRHAWRDSDGDHQSEELGFLRINNPKEVEKMLKNLANEAQGKI